MMEGSTTTHPRDGYLRGLADGRRTVEAELEAERYAVATLANSLGEAVAQLTLYLNPNDMARLDVDMFEITVLPDRLLYAGGVRLSGAAL
jgi:hypothetical protein